MDDIALIPNVSPVAKIPMPTEIAKAVIAVMKKIKQLGVDEKNQHGGYNYVSVDKFFDHVGRLMADADIFDLVNEVSSVTERKEAVDSYGKIKVSNWMTCEYAIYLYHASGAEYGPIMRTVQVAATGPQSYGSAMSFVEKYFLRGLFKIPTGEKDADQDEQGGLPPQRQNNLPQDDAGADASVLRYVKNAKTRIGEFKKLSTLKDWWASEEKTMAGFFHDDKDPQFRVLRAAYIERGTKLQAAETALPDLATPKALNGNGSAHVNDSIPY